jgi:hypothetical protein
MDIKETGWESVDWMPVARNMDQWRVVVTDCRLLKEGLCSNESVISSIATKNTIKPNFNVSKLYGKGQSSTALAEMYYTDETTRQVKFGTHAQQNAFSPCRLRSRIILRIHHANYSKDRLMGRQFLFLGSSVQSELSCLQNWIAHNLL